MDQLLSIKHIPIKIEVKVTNAQLKPKENTDPSSPAVTASQGQGGVKLAAQPYKADLTQNYDTYSAALPDDGLTLTYNAVASLSSAQNEAQLINGAPNQNGDIGDIAAKSVSRNIESILGKLPKTKNNPVSYNDGTLSINYSLDRSSSTVDDISSLSDGFEFVPGSIEFKINQMPDLEIEYTGEPIYFPRSADPNYEGEMNLIV